MALNRQNQYESYKSTEISTANQGKLIIMLYDGAIRFMKLARDNMNHTTYDVVNTNIVKSQDIITELMLSLDMQAGGEVAQSLFNLYAYLKKRLIEANMSKDITILDEVIGHMTQLKTAWESIAQKEAGHSDSATARKREQGMSFSIHG
jgi:flagellar protein FliS